MGKSAKREAVEAAMSVAEDLTTGKISPEDLDAAAEAECRGLFGRVEGPGDPLWELHVDVARQVLALDGVPRNELVEWVAVHRDAPQPAAAKVDVSAEPVSRPSVDVGLDIEASRPVADQFS